MAVRSSRSAATRSPVTPSGPDPAVAGRSRLAAGDERRGDAIVELKPAGPLGIGATSIDGVGVGVVRALRRAALPLVRLAGGTVRRRDLALKVATWPAFDAWWRRHRPGRLLPRESDRRDAFFAEVRRAAGIDGPITYLEFGVWRGESIRWWAEVDEHLDSRFVGFDSFEGLPERWTDDKGEGTFSTGGRTPEIGDPRVSFVPGWFHLTVPAFATRLEPADRRTQRLVVHLDADLYRSTALVLAHLGPVLGAGDVLVFDEFADSIHEFRAFEDYQATFQVRWTLVAATEGGHRVAIRLDSGPGAPATA